MAERKSPSGLNQQLQGLFYSIRKETAGHDFFSALSDSLSSKEIQVRLQELSAQLEQSHARRTSPTDEYRQRWVGQVDDVLQQAGDTTTPQFREEIRRVYVEAYDNGETYLVDNPNIQRLFKDPKGIFDKTTAKAIERDWYMDSLHELTELEDPDIEPYLYSKEYRLKRLPYLRKLLPSWKSEYQNFYGEELP